MTLMVTMPNLIANRQANKLDITFEDAAQSLPLSGEIKLYVGDTVGHNRSMEIFTGWEMLWNGVRDRNLFENPQSAIEELITVVDINSKTANNRRTSWTALPNTPNDVGIAFHWDVMQQLRATNMVENAVVMLKDFALERIFKLA